MRNSTLERVEVERLIIEEFNAVNEENWNNYVDHIKTIESTM